MKLTLSITDVISLLRQMPEHERIFFGIALMAWLAERLA
jgi:hypothetical protein